MTKHIRTIVVLRENFPPGFDEEITEAQLEEHAERVKGVVEAKLSHNFHYELEAVTTIEEE